MSINKQDPDSVFVSSWLKEMAFHINSAHSLLVKGNKEEAFVEVDEAQKTLLTMDMYINAEGGDGELWEELKKLCNSAQAMLSITKERHDLSIPMTEIFSRKFYDLASNFGTTSYYDPGFTGMLD